MNLEIASELLKFSVRVNGILASEVCMCHVVKPSLQCCYSLERGTSVVDGCRQLGGVLPRRLNDISPPLPHRLDVALQASGEQRNSMRP